MLLAKPVPFDDYREISSICNISFYTYRLSVSYTESFKIPSVVKRQLFILRHNCHCLWLIVNSLVLFQQQKCLVFVFSLHSFIFFNFTVIVTVEYEFQNTFRTQYLQFFINILTVGFQRINLISSYFSVIVIAIILSLKVSIVKYLLVQKFVGGLFATFIKTDNFIMFSQPGFLILKILSKAQVLWCHFSKRLTK